MLNTAHSLAAIGPQTIDVSRNVQQLALNGSIAELNDTALPRASDLAQQWGNLWGTLTTQLAALNSFKVV